MNDKNDDLMKILITKEFLQLYFLNFGAGMNLEIDSLKEIYDLKEAKEKEKFLFAIVKTKLGESTASVVKNLNSKQTEDKKINECKMIYPKDDSNIHSSLRFLYLAYSGFLNTENIDEIFSDELENSKENGLKSLFNEGKKLEQSEIKKSFFDSNNKLQNKNVIDTHNKFITHLCQDKINRVSEKLGEDSNTGYSLFFIKNGYLIEYESILTSKLRIVEKGVSENNARDIILEHIIKTNEKNELKYINDLTVFTLNEQKEVKEDKPVSEGLLIILITSIIFIIIFFIINPQNNFYEMKKTYENYFEIENGVNLYSKITNVDELKQNFYRITEKLYSSERKNTDRKIYFKLFNTNESYIEINGDNYYPLESNYYCGLLVNFRKANFSNATDIANNTYEIRNTKTSYFNTEVVYNKEDFLNFINNDKNPLLSDSFSFYFKPSINDIQKQWYLDQIDPIFDKQLYEFMYTIMIYDSNKEASLMYSVKFVLNSFGEITYDTVYQGFLPFLSSIENNIFFLIMSILYFLGFLYILFLVIRTTVHLKISEFPFEWYYWIDILVLTVSFVSQIISYKSFLFLNKDFPIAINFEDEFIFWINHALNNKLYLRITGIAILLICFRLVRFLYTSFPSIGIVFKTLGNAYKEILAFMIIVCSILIGLSMMSHVAFGSYSPNFSNLNSSIVIIFLMFVGIFDYRNFDNSNYINPIAPYFFVFFMVFMNLILINTFLCIIRNNYAEVKEKTEKYNQAHSLFVRDKTNEFKSKLENLILCKSTQQIYLEEQKLKSKDLDEETNQKQDQSRSTGGSMWANLIVNIKNLEIKKFIFDDPDDNEFEEKKYAKYKEIDENNLIKFIEEVDQDYERDSEKIVSTFCFIIFVVIAVIIMYFEGMLDFTSDVQRNIRNNLNIQFDLNNKNINQVIKEIEDFIDLNYGLQSNSSKDCTIKDHFIPGIIENYSYLNTPYFRLTFRLKKYDEVNTSELDNSFFYAKNLNHKPEDEDNCNSESEFMTNIELKNDNQIIVANYQYSKKGTFSSPYKCGGYVYYTNTTSPYCANNFSENIDTFIEALTYNFLDTKYTVSTIYLDYSIASEYYPIIVYAQVKFNKHPDGNFYTYINTKSIPIQRYVSERDFNTMVIEIIYIIFIAYYSYDTLGKILEILRKLLVDDYNRENGDVNFSNSSYLNKFLRINFKELEEESFVKTIFFILLKIIEKFILIMIFLITSIIKFITADLFNFIDLFSIMLSLYHIIEMFSIVKKVESFDFIYRNSDTNMNYTLSKNNISLANELYTRILEKELWTSINGFLILLRLVNYYTCFKPFKILVSVIGKVKLTIIFHLLFIAVLNFGFAMFAYALFSHNSNNFSSIGSTILHLLVMLGGNINYMELSEFDRDWAGIFVVLFIFLNSLILFNILSAIIIISYKEIRKEYQNIDNKSENYLTFIINTFSRAFDVQIKTAQHIIDNLYSFNHEVTEECDKNHYLVHDNSSLFNNFGSKLEVRLF